jgi:hypothetical protein
MRDIVSRYVRSMTTPALPDLPAMMAAAEIEWRANAPEDWTTLNNYRLTPVGSWSRRY